MLYQHSACDSLVFNSLVAVPPGSIQAVFVFNPDEILCSVEVTWLPVVRGLAHVYML